MHRAAGSRSAVARFALAPLRVTALGDGADHRHREVLRDTRGRFVAFPTTSAPSWYVLCADSYRVPGEAEVMPVPVSAAPAPQPLPAARVVRRPRPGMRRDQIVNWVVMLIFLVAMYWYAFSLSVPHR